MGLSFLVPKDTHALTVSVRWGDYEQTEIDGPEGKPFSVWQRHPREATVSATLTGASDPGVHNVPDSGGLQLHVVERVVSAQDLEGHLPQGTRSVSVFLVNHRTPVAPEQGEPDLAYVFQPELQVQSDQPFVPRPDLRGARAAEWDEQVADLHYADTPEYATGHGISAEWEIVDSACSLLRGPEGRPEAAVIALQLARSVLAQRAGDDCRDLMRLFYLEDRSYSEIASSLGLPVGTVKSRLSRCLEAAHRLVTGKGPGRHP